MQSAIVVLERSSITPKYLWRESSYCRTLAPIEFRHVIRGAWEAYQREAAEQGGIVVSLALDGSAKDTQAVQTIHGQAKSFIGVFEISFISPDRVKVVLRGEECARRTRAPGHHTRQVALLRPWQPIRVLLNGRGAYHSGQFYLLLEYHLALCIGPAPDDFGPARFVDLQADLF